MRILSISCEKESNHTCIIAFRINVAVFFFRQGRKKPWALTEPDLEGQQSARAKPRRGLLNQFAHQLLPPRAGKERDLRIVQDFPRKSMPILRGDIGKIRNDQVECFIQVFKKIAFSQLDASTQPK